MLADAVAAEAYKFLRQRGGLFWGFCAVPLGMLVFHLVVDTWMGSRIRLAMGVDLGRQILDGLNGGGSAFFHIFFIAGAVAIFSGEYRWETWRLLTPRNSRANLLSAKFIVYAVSAALSLLALGAAYGVHAVYSALLNSAPLILPGAGFALQAAGVFLVSWAELLLIGLFAGLVAVSTRAMVGPLIAAICFSFAQAMALMLLGPADAALRWFAAFPGMSAWYLRAWITGEQILPGIYPDTARALPAALFILGWIGLLGAAALVRFQRPGPDARVISPG
jgi:ABC-2 type transport system permease protein